MRAVLLLLLLVFASLPARAERLDTEIEKFLGKQVAWALTETSGQDIDPLLLRWVQGVGAKTAARSPRQDVRYTFNILGTDTANAFAAPGGYIFVTRGLLDSIESDDELASVLAHETAHVAKRHATQQIGETLVFLGLLSLVKGKDADEIKTAAQVINIFRTLHKSREMEAQADDLGLEYAAGAGYNPEGLVRFFQRIGGGQSRLEEYFATHPSPARRVEKARQSPLVRRTEPEVRRTLAAGYEARGLRGAAEKVRRGEDPLAPLPERPPTVMPPVVQERRQAVAKRVGGVRGALGASFRAQRIGGRLQNLLLINNRLDDYRWVLLAIRAYGVQTDVENVYARVLRVLRATGPTYDGLAAYADAPPASPAALNSAIGRDEVEQAMEKVEGAPKPLARASQAALAVLADLNNPFHRRPHGTAALLRYGTLEGLVRYAESELARADKASGQAWRLLSMARIRRYEARLNELIPKGDAARRALWTDLTARRLGGPFAAEGPAGEATVRAALAVELGKEASSISEGRGDTPWADWALAKGGVPENIATVLRLLTLDLERETAAEDRRQATDG